MKVKKANQRQNAQKTLNGQKRRQMEIKTLNRRVLVVVVGEWGASKARMESWLPERMHGPGGLVGKPTPG